MICSVPIFEPISKRLKKLVDTDVKEEEGLGFRVQVLVDTDVNEEEGIHRWGEGGEGRGGERRGRKGTLVKA